MNYGLDRDFSARFNAPNYSPWQALNRSEPDPVAEQSATESLEKQEQQRAMWRAASARYYKAKTTRVNANASLGYATGMAKQVQEIKEARRSA
jgi:hypothetical protein